MPGPHSRSLACAAVLLLAAQQAHAQSAPDDDASRAVARQLGMEGIDAYQANDFATAEQKLNRAFRLFPAPTLALFSARARAKLGDLVAAAERYRQASRSVPEAADSAAQRAAQREAAEELEALLPRIPTLTVVVRGASAQDVSVTLDASTYSSELLSIARPTNPGTHSLFATSGRDRVGQAVTLTEQEHKTVSLQFHQLQPEAASPVAAAATLSPPPVTSTLWRPVGVATLSLGAVGLITWGLSTLIADNKLDDCGVVKGIHACANESDAEAYRMAKTVSKLSFWTGAGLTLAGAGVLLWDGLERSAAPNQVSWSVGPSGAAMRVVF